MGYAPSPYSYIFGLKKLGNDEIFFYETGDNDKSFGQLTEINTFTQN